MRYLLAVLFFACLPVAGAFAQSLPGNVYDTAPFNANPKYFGSSNCRPTFSCSQQSDDTAMVRLADKCANENFGFPAGIMSKFMGKGTYKNCVIPGSYAKQGAGMGAKAQWPICCTKDNGNNTCEMVCHFYITNDVQ